MTPPSHSCMSRGWLSRLCFLYAHCILQDILCALSVLHDSVHRLMSLYCTSFFPGYLPEWDEAPRDRQDICSMTEQMLRIRVAALHRPQEAELRK